MSDLEALQTAEENLLKALNTASAVCTQLSQSTHSPDSQQEHLTELSNDFLQLVTDTQTALLQHLDNNVTPLPYNNSNYVSNIKKQ